MSKQVGLIKLKGTMGGVSFFQSEGKHLARMASGPSKERILRDANFQRTRENNAEFGGSATAAKAFRDSLNPVMNMSDSRITSRVLKTFKEINSKGIGVRGQRSISLSANAVHVLNMELNINNSLSSLFSGTLVSVPAADRKSATLTLNNIIAGDVVNAPEGATHVMFVQALGLVADYIYNTNTNRYEPVNALLNGFGNVTHSAYTPIAQRTPTTISLNTALPTPLALSTDVTVIQCFGIAFYQFVAGSYYPLAQNNAMKVIGTF